MQFFAFLKNSGIFQDFVSSERYPYYLIHNIIYMKTYIDFMKKKQLFTVIIEEDNNGFFAYCPQLQGCYTQGETYEEALLNIKDVIKLHTEDRIEEGQTWRSPKSINVTSLEVSI